jgi:ABC-type dipeptide/oligopeptide/nickel transport system permease component
MTPYLLRRLLLMVPTLIGITFIVFTLVALAPGGVKARLDAGTADADTRAAEEAYLSDRYGLDDHPLLQYAHWLARLSPIRPDDQNSLTLDWPDLGLSFSRHRPVAHLIAEALPVTLLLNLLAFFLAWVIALPAGCLAALRRATRIDAALRALFIGLWSIPIVAAAVLLQGWIAARFGWLPLFGLHNPDARDLPFTEYLFDAAKHLILPVLCLSYGSLALISRQARAAILEQLASDHVRAARAKGLTNSILFRRHVLRNSLLPLITLFSSMVPALLSGSIVVERVFNIPGMGLLMLDAIESRDREVLLACTLIASVVTLLSTLAADLLYAAADPRITVQGAP